MFVTLNNGVKMPQVGLGVYKVDEGEVVINSVKKALEVGYRLIDTAAFYKNEHGVGQAIRESGVPREEVFVTTKVWNSDQGYDKTLQAFEESMEKLGLEYLDLYLIHWPLPKQDKYVETYRALEKLYEDGRVRAIGVSNFEPEHLEKLMAHCNVKPVVNQVECHPYLAQKELKDYCKKHDIIVEAWGPLMRGREVLDNDVIQAIAAKHGKSPAQVILRWHLQHDVIVIPKSVTPSRIEENFQVFDFELSAEEMKQIDALDRNERTGHHPNEMHLF